MRRPLLILLSAVAGAAGLLLAGAAAHAKGMSIDASGTRVEMGTAVPGQPALLSYSTHLTVHSGAPYSLLVDAPAEFSTVGPPVLAMPIGRLQWRGHALGGLFQPFVAGMQVILGAQPPTPPAGQTIVLDLRLVPTYADLPTRPDGSDPYTAALTYTVTAGTIDQAYAWPNPFSPDGDGVNDQTELHWYQDEPRAVDVLVYDGDGAILLRTVTVAKALGAGAQSIAWDGRDDQRELVSEGDYLWRVRVNPGEPTDGGLTIASGLVGLERGIGSGTATVTGRVLSSQDTAPVATATVELYRAGGSRVAQTTTDLAGVYEFAGVGGGLYYLEVTAPLHFPFTSADFEVLDGQTVVVDVRLTHNHSLTIAKKADVTDVEPGDLVGYTVEVTASGVEPVAAVVVYDDLPPGLRFIPGSARIGGQRLPADAEPTAGRGRALAIPLGTIAAGATITLSYEAIVVVGTRAGPLYNRARATGLAAGQEVAAGPTHARVFVHDGDMGDRSLLFGRVFLDANGNGVFDGTDRPLPYSRVVLDDGTIAIPDPEGRYSVRGVRDGPRALMVVVDPTKGESGGGAAVVNGPSRVVVTDIRYGVAARVDFPMTQAELDDWPGVVRDKTVLGFADVTIGVGVSDVSILTVLGRLAGFVEWDLGGGYRVTAYVDTAHDPRDEQQIGQDALSFQPETGDDARVQRSVPDKLGVRLLAPWGSATVGRIGSGLKEGDLINHSRGLLGVEGGARTKTWSARVFGGLADSLQKLDVVANDGSTGPFVLSERPVVPGSERALMVARNDAGDVVERTQLTRDRDYTVDYANGQVFLTAPWPTRTPAGEMYELVVQYEYAPAEELPVAPVAGARGDWRISDEASVGVTAVVEDAEPEALAAAGVDGEYSTDKLLVRGEAAVSTRGAARPEDLPGDDPTAVRVRTTYRPRDDVALFGYVSRIGGAYTPSTDFQATVAGSGEQRFGYLPPPSLTILGPAFLRGQFNGNRLFPFTLQGAADRMEWGLGTRYEPRDELAFSAGSFDLYNDASDDPEVDGFTNHTDYVTANYTPAGYPSLFVATTGSTRGSSGESERAAFAGSQWTAGVFAVGAEVRHVRREVPGGQDVAGNAALVRGRYRKYRRLQPAGLVMASRETRADGSLHGSNRMVATGVESQWTTVLGYAYATFTSAVDGQRFNTRQESVGAFTGVNVARRRVYGSLRADVSDSTGYGFRFGFTTRFRLRLTEDMFSFGDVQYSGATDADPLPRWNNTFGVAYRPVVRPRFFLFLKYKDRSQPAGIDAAVERRRYQLATVDFVVPFRVHGTVGLRTAYKRVFSAAGYIHMMVAAEQVNWNVAKRWDLIAGGRVSTSSVGGETLIGTTVGAGFRFERGIRLVLGWNYAAADWAFEADGSIPGVFLNLTGVYGSAGAPAVLPYQ